jgi:hypothetical protein
MKEYVKLKNDDIKTFIILTIGALSSYKFGIWCNHLQSCIPEGSWKTPNFTGNNGRGAIYPYIEQPWHGDHEEIRDHERFKSILLTELLTSYRLK